MTDLLSMYRYAEDEGIEVDWFPMERASSLSVPLPDGTYAIAMDPWKMPTLAMEKVNLTHEVGHCKMDAFYNQWAACDVRKQQENKADKWAIQKLIPVDELDDAVAKGHTELWDLAEYFGVTEDFMRKAVCWYTHGNLDAELYF